jgi:hypothetical protein
MSLAYVFSFFKGKENVQESVKSNEKPPVVSSSETKRVNKHYEFNFAEYGKYNHEVHDGPGCYTYECDGWNDSDIFRGIRRFIKASKTNITHYGYVATHIYEDVKTGEQFMFKQENVNNHPTDDSKVRVSLLSNESYTRDFYPKGLAETPMFHWQLKNNNYIYLSQKDVDCLTHKEKIYLKLIAPVVQPPKPVVQQLPVGLVPDAEPLKSGACKRLQPKEQDKQAEALLELFRPTSNPYQIVFKQDGIIGIVAPVHAFVAVGDDSPYYGKDDDEINGMDFPQIHSPVTWSKSYEDTLKVIPIDFPELNTNHWLIGWDYLHYGNTASMIRGLQSGEGSFEIRRSDCIKMCNQLIYQQNNPDE